MIKVGSEFINNDTCVFNLWAPFIDKPRLKIIHPWDKVLEMESKGDGYWQQTLSRVTDTVEYYYIIDGNTLPDPASHYQPEGVHGPSRVVKHEAFNWNDNNWKNIPLEDYIIYELHTGTFTPEGTFEAIIARLKDLKETGITAIELMPVAQFPGNRNWGYDGVHPFGVQNSYGGPDKLKRLVEACHNEGLAVILDVVYNHLGPEGNYLEHFAPYFTSKYNTFWGKAVNLDDAYSDHVRGFFIQNALYWLEHYHIDALRLDAIHALFDLSAHPFLQQLAETVHDYNIKSEQNKYLIAESGLNDSKVVRDRKSFGLGMDAQWNDDFHHCVHALVTGESNGYYEDYGRLEQLVKVMLNNFAYSGEYSNFRKCKFGNDASFLPSNRFVVSIQNHDQTGNRKDGERLSVLAGYEELKLAAGIMLVSPFIPLLFMGEEYAENNPFLYFIHHSDESLVLAVREGRKNEFSTFEWKGNIPDPQSIETFNKSKIDWDKRNTGKNKTLLNFYTKLIKLRKEYPGFHSGNNKFMDVEIHDQHQVLFMTKQFKNNSIITICNFEESPHLVEIRNKGNTWKKVIDSSGKEWEGPGSRIPEIIDTKKIEVNAKSILILKNA